MYLRSTRAIRDRCSNIFSAGLAGALKHFEVDLDRLEDAALYVADTTRHAYPDLSIPYHSRWNHFRAGRPEAAAARMMPLDEYVRSASERERGRCLTELVVTSVLLDAGAGSDWCYVEKDSGLLFTRSEGLAVASLYGFLGGAFSSDPAHPYRVDAAGLLAMTEERLAEAFQVSAQNPLVGLDGRVALLRRLGEAVARNAEMFGTEPGEPPRLGGLFDFLDTRASAGAGQGTGKRLEATAILDAVLTGLGDIWPGRITLGSYNLGDVWRHPAAGGSGPSAGLVPFHKLSQWLTYSLFEPLEQAGIEIIDPDELTGLPEYRNGGLFLDTLVLVPKHEAVTARAHVPSSELVVEWRALTVALLDRVADPVRRMLGCLDLPLAKILEGGTWSAGRRIAREMRPDGRPPIAIDSDGTVF